MEEVLSKEGGQHHFFRFGGKKRGPYLYPEGAGYFNLTISTRREGLCHPLQEEGGLSTKEWCLLSPVPGGGDKGGQL